MDKFNFLVLGLVLLLCVCCTTEKPSGLDGAGDKNISVDQTTSPEIVTISTDKTEYLQGEVIQIIVENQMDKPITYKFAVDRFWDLEYLKDGNWTYPVYYGSSEFQVTDQEVGNECYMIVAEMPAALPELKPKSNISSEWNQRICPFGTDWSPDKPLRVIYIKGGEYRFVFEYNLHKTIYSNTFKISGDEPNQIKENEAIYSNTSQVSQINFSVFKDNEGISRGSVSLDLAMPLDNESACLVAQKACNSTCVYTMKKSEIRGYDWEIILEPVCGPTIAFINETEKKVGCHCFYE